MIDHCLLRPVVSAISREIEMCSCLELHSLRRRRRCMSSQSKQAKLCETLFLLFCHANHIGVPCDKFSIGRAESFVLILGALCCALPFSKIFQTTSTGSLGDKVVRHPHFHLFPCWCRTLAMSTDFQLKDQRAMYQELRLLRRPVLIHAKWFHVPGRPDGFEPSERGRQRTMHK